MAPEAQISVWDGVDQDEFLGQVTLRLILQPGGKFHSLNGWFPLEARDTKEDQVSGELRATIYFLGVDDMDVGPADFEIMKVVERGDSCQNHASVGREMLTRGRRLFQSNLHGAEEEHGLHLRHEGLCQEHRLREFECWSRGF